MDGLGGSCLEEAIRCHYLAAKKIWPTVLLCPRDLKSDRSVTALQIKRGSEHRTGRGCRSTERAELVELRRKVRAEAGGAVTAAVVEVGSAFAFRGSSRQSLDASPGKTDLSIWAR